MTKPNSLRIRQYTTRAFALSSLLAFAFGPGCSAEPDAPPGEPVAPSGGALTVGTGNGCTVEFTKFNYDTPAANDVGEFIELKIVKSSGSAATTVGDCGLGSIVLVNGSNCATYGTAFALAALPIPADGFLTICDQAWQASCDVDTGQDFLQNGAPDVLSFRAPNGSETVHATYEGSAACVLDAGAGTNVTLPSEENAAPDMLSVWCNGAFELQAAATNLPGTENVCGSDAGSDAGADADAASDSPVDTGSDATDAPVDTGSDATDAPVDTGSDATDAPVDTGSDASDAGTDAPADTGSDAPADTGSDATGDASTDSGTKPSNLVIAEVYGGGGNNAPYDHDFIVLFNKGSAPVSLAGLFIQYGSASGNFNGTGSNAVALPSVSVNPGQYYLIQGATSGSTSTTPLPTPDFNAGFNMSLSDGKVALVFGAPLNGCGATGNACPTASIVDLVGYGSASQFEGSAAAPALSIQNSGARKQHGCQDTDQNANDFTAAAPTPKNTSSPLNNCALQDGGTGGTGGTGGATGGTGGATGGTGGATGGTGGATGGTGGATGGAAGSAGTAGAAGAATGGSGGSGGSGGTTGGSGGTTGGSGGTKFDAGVGGSAGIGSSGDDGGCGCSVPGERSLPKGTALFALLGSALFARRRSSRR